MIIVPHIPIISKPDVERNFLTTKCRMIFRELEIQMMKIATVKKVNDVMSLPSSSEQLL